ncbi:unnamed protein product [Calypogeia fissa]
MASCKAENHSTMVFMVMTLLLFSAFLMHGAQAGRGGGLLPDRSLLEANYHSWSPGHATFYGGPDASGTNGGACGYQNALALGYGTHTAAISDMLYDKGLACGACFEVKCVGSKCRSNTVVVTATNESPQYTTAHPGPHFDLAQPAFDVIAPEVLGSIIIQYKRVTCHKKGGIKFQIQGSKYWMSVLVYNVGGAGDVRSLSVKGSNTSWKALQHQWGQNWASTSVLEGLDGYEISFSTTTSDGKTLHSYNVGGKWWKYGHTYEGSQYY